MKAMISQPMAGKTNDEIKAAREKAITKLKNLGYEIVNTLFSDEWYNSEKMESRGVVQITLCFLAKSLENMSLCHAAYFLEGWEKARGCRIEHEAAVAYGLTIIYEEAEGERNMKTSDLKELLCEQLELLAEKSKTCEDMRILCELSNAMEKLGNLLFINL